MVGGVFQALTWVLGVFWENAEAQLVFEHTSRAHILFEIFMIWQQFHANSDSTYGDNDEYPTVTKMIIGAHVTGILFASAEQKFITEYFAARNNEVEATDAADTDAAAIDDYATML